MKGCQNLAIEVYFYLPLNFKSGRGALGGKLQYLGLLALILMAVVTAAAIGTAFYLYIDGGEPYPPKQIILDLEKTNARLNQTDDRAELAVWPITRPNDVCGERRRRR